MAQIHSVPEFLASETWAQFQNSLPSAEQVSAGISQWANDTVQALAPIMQEVAKVAKEMCDAVYAEYLAQGAPYGETQEGMLQWLDDMGEIRRLQSQIDEIHRRHEWKVFLRDFSRKIAAKQVQH